MPRLERGRNKKGKRAKKKERENRGSRAVFKLQPQKKPGNGPSNKKNIFKKASIKGKRKEDK